MDLHQLRCFVAAAERLHFGRAAQQLNMMPAALGRHVRMLEEDLRVSLIARTTRNVALTKEGAEFLPQAIDLLAQADRLATAFRARSREKARSIRIGAIDSAAVGLIPALLHDIRSACPGIVVALTESKTIHLLPRLLSGQLDLAFIRPPATVDERIEFFFLCHESPIVAVSSAHPLALRSSLTITDLIGAPMIVPERQSRPHSHDLTMKLFAEIGAAANVVQIADEKQTIVNLVATGLGLAIVPRWTSHLAARGVTYVPLTGSSTHRLPLAAAWLRGTKDIVRENLIGTIRDNLKKYFKQA